jgi:uncharacterized coiled-coil DUF342 family protein
LSFSISNEKEIFEIVDLTKFTELENKINGLLENYVLLKKRNIELEDQLQNKTKELEDQLQNKTKELEQTNLKIEDLKEEKDAIRAKVDSLLDLLQEIKAP